MSCYKNVKKTVSIEIAKLGTCPLKNFSGDTFESRILILYSLHLKFPSLIKTLNFSPSFRSKISSFWETGSLCKFSDTVFLLFEKFFLLHLL